MSQEKLGHSELPQYDPPPTNASAPSNTNYDQVNYGFDNSGTAGRYPMNPPATNQQRYGYAGPATGYSNVVVTQVGPGTGPVYTMPPSDYTVQAWLVCLFCFWPTGLMAIIKAHESQDCVSRGDMVGAHAAANSARQMVKISIIVGIVSLVLAGVILGVTLGVVLNNINNIYDYNY